MIQKWRTIFISDLHLCANGCEAELLADFLDNNWCERLVLVGDIIDGWRAKSSILKLILLNRNKYGIFCDVHQVRSIKRLLSKITKTKVEYVLGNHDDFLEGYVDDVKEFGNLTLHRMYDYVSLNGKKYLVLHGHQFDGIIKYHECLAFLADYSYGFLLFISKMIQWFRNKFGLKGYWSLSYVIKHKVKQGIEIIYDFEKSMVNYCKAKKYNGVICGHTHFAADKEVDGIHYLNCGDWVDSCTAIVEDYDGNFKLLNWGERRENSNTDRFVDTAS